MTDPRVDSPVGNPLRRHITDVLDLQPDAPAIEYEGQWFTWGQVAHLARRIGSLIRAHTATPQPQVGVLLRNRPAHVAALLGVLCSDATVVTINPARGDDRTRAEIRELRLPLLIGAADDVTTLVAPSDPATVIAISDLAHDPEVIAAHGRVGGTDGERPGVAVRMLTSGTTGPPKRIDLTYDMLARSVLGPEPDRAPPPTELRRGVAIINAPLVHIGGVFRVLQCVAEARSFVLLPRFELDRWAEAVRTHRPRAVSLVPAALRMVLHSGLTRADLESIRAVTSGTAPLSAEDADAFTAKYGIPVLTSYAATEFGGGVAGWTLADHRKYWHAKRGSVGRADTGAQLRVVDDEGTPLRPDQTGLLEVKPGQLGERADWIRTTDMARIDTDGFLWILGRADQAIIRGGFKVMPDDVRSALEHHPAVEGAAVVGRRDERLGETPVAMVELRESTSADQHELMDFLRTRLARYEIPTEIAIVDAIPRTPSGKADLTAVRDYFSHARSAEQGDHAR
jgi:long-chain acyl-CoA synthetase